MRSSSRRWRSSATASLKNGTAGCRFYFWFRLSGRGYVPAADHQRTDRGKRVRRRGARLHDGLRHHPAHQFRARRSGDDRRDGRLHRDQCARALRAAAAHDRPHRHRLCHPGVHAGRLCDGASRLSAAAPCAAPRAAHHRDRRGDHPAASRAPQLEPQRACLSADHSVPDLSHRRRGDHHRADRDPRDLLRHDGGARDPRVSHPARHRDARHRAESPGGGPDGRRHQPGDCRHLPHRRRARRGSRRSLRHLLRARAVHHGPDPRPESVFSRGARRHGQYPRGDAGRRAARHRRGARRRLHRRLHQPVRLRHARRAHRRLRRRRQFRAVRFELPGRVRLHRADSGAGVPPFRIARRARRRARMKRWVGVALIALSLAVLPFALAQIGTTWVRITNYAILYVLIALGLNIVVGFAGLLDLGYIAFYAVGAYTYALLASPHFNLHLPFWVILPIGAAIAALFGIILGAPTLKLRGDYLAIVTLGFGEIIRIFLNNLSRPVNITNGPQGITRIDAFSIGGFDFSSRENWLGLEFSGPIQHYYLLIALTV